MTKSELVETILQRMPQLPRRSVEQMINVIFTRMAQALTREERIEIRGFGTFCVRVREAHSGRNPKTGETVDVPKRRLLHFSTGKELRERLDRDAASAGSVPEKQRRSASRAGPTGVAAPRALP